MAKDKLNITSPKNGRTRKISKRVHEQKPAHENANSKLTTDKLELLITVVNRSKAEFYIDLLQSFDVNMQVAVRAHGTANQQMLRLLGLEDLPKVVIFSMIREDKLQEALAALKNKFSTIKDGGGVAYTVPMSSVIGVSVFGFLSNNLTTVKEEKNENV